MAFPKPLHDDHQVLGESYCSGYMDGFGNWNNGFECPTQDVEQPVYCCGSDNLKYCCSKTDMHALTHTIPQLPLILGVVFGVAVALIVIVVVCCFHCSCCLLYKKRQPTNGGPLYQLQCSSAASGVANMYSFSGTTTPSETPRSLSRSQGTVYSGSSVSHRLEARHLGDMEARPAGVPSFTSDPRPRSHHRPVSTSLSDHSSCMSEVGVMSEPPPPYNAPHSTLVAVRTSTLPTQPQPRPSSPTLTSPYIISGCETHYSSGPFSTFPQTFLSPASPSRPTLPPVSTRGPPHPPPAAASSTFTSALTPTTRPCSTAHVIHTHHHHTLDDHLYTATKF